jgi:hypothetical protein
VLGDAIGLVVAEVAKHSCSEEACRRIDGEECGRNDECVSTCIGDLCTVLSGLGGVCDDSADCTAPHACNGEICRLADGQTCGVDDDCANVCISLSCAARSDYGGPCETVSDCKDSGSLCSTTCERFCPGTETCDGTDDDCDNGIDEDCSATCGTMSMFHDDFADGALGAGWLASATSGSNASTAEGGGVLVLTPGQPVPGYAEYVSARTYDLRADILRIEVTATTVQHPAHEQYFGIQGKAGARYYFQVINNSLRAIRKTASGTSTLGSTLWSHATQRFWRLRHSGGDVVFETSMDNSGWNIFADSPAGSELLQAVRVVIGAGSTADSGAAPAFAGFDNLNGGVGSYDQGGLRWCSAASLRDAFSGSLPTERYTDTLEGASGALVVTGGQVTLTPPSDVAGVARRRTTDSFRLTNGELTVRLVQSLTTSPDGELRFSVNGSGDDFVGFLLSNGTLGFAYDGAGGPAMAASVNYNAQLHRYLRLRERGGSTHWETSPDGELWSTRATVGNPLDPNVVVIELSARSKNAVSVGTARFDDLNLVP